MAKEAADFASLVLTHGVDGARFALDGADSSPDPSPAKEGPEGGGQGEGASHEGSVREMSAVESSAPGSPISRGGGCGVRSTRERALREAAARADEADARAERDFRQSLMGFHDKAERALELPCESAIEGAKASFSRAARYYGEDVAKIKLHQEPERFARVIFDFSTMINKAQKERGKVKAAGMSPAPAEDERPVQRRRPRGRAASEDDTEEDGGYR